MIVVECPRETRMNPDRARGVGAIEEEEEAEESDSSEGGGSSRAISPETERA